MSPITNTTFAKTRLEVLTEMLSALRSAVSDAYIGPDGVINILFTVEAAQFETLFLANQILLQDSFPQTASSYALKLFGEMFSIPQLIGQPSIGAVKFIGEDGVLIPAGSQVGAPRTPGLDPLIFVTDSDVTVAAPGIPTPPTAVVNVTAGNLNANYEYAVTFVTASGETMQSPDSIAVSPVNQQVDLTNIPIGGTGTTARKVYRQKNGTGAYQLVTTIANNTATTYTDNIADGSVGANAPSIDTAHSVTVNATAEKTGADGNVVAGSINILANVPQGVLSVINNSAFTDGSDDEDIESYRGRLMERLGDPNTGSDSDLKAWAEEVQGVDQATVFDNDNVGVATPGHATVRIAGPGSSIPSAGVVAEVLAELKEKDIANITIHVATFTPKVQNVTTDVTPDSTHLLSDVTPSVQQAVADYIDAIPVGGTLYVAGLVDAIFGLAGIIDVVVSVPGSNVTSLNTEKFQVGTVTVT